MTDTPLPSFFSRVGGKRLLCRRISDLIPTDIDTYVEPFIGGGSVFLTRKYAEKEVIGDLDRDIYHLWSDLREITHDDLKEFEPKIAQGSKEEFFTLQSKKDIVEPKERFYRNIFISKRSFAGSRRSYWGPSNDKQEGLKTISRNLEKYKQRLSNTTIHNIDFRQMIRLYDSPTTFFYFDPPYSQQKNSWGYIDNLTPIDMLDAVSHIKGRWLISYDDSEEVRSLFSDYTIREIQTKYSMNAKSDQKVKTELLISNY